MRRLVLLCVVSAVCCAQAVSLVPQPRKLVEKGGVTTNAAVRYVTDAAIPAEGYRLSVTPEGTVVSASDEAGRFYAGVTRDQLRIPGGGREPDAWPCVEIEDSPAYRWRGLLVDEGRHFFGKDVIRRVIDRMALHKLNRLHWHLTEDQGWRLDVPGYPELVRYGAVRSASPRHGVLTKGWLPLADNLQYLNDERYGPYFYTEKDVREIVAYAAAHHVVIVPEIELPGHVYAALAAYPRFACNPENLKSRDPRVFWGIEKDVLCLGNDEALKFFEDVLNYVCRIFPGDVVHIGGDECPQERWKTCPKCQARIRAEGLKDEKGLQPWVTQRFVRFLEQRGKRVIGWDEYLLGDVPKSAIGMSWREDSKHGAGHELVSGAAAALRGHDVVMTPKSFCYLDYGQGLKDDPFLYGGGRVTLADCHRFDPCAGVPGAARTHVLGGQGNCWSEYTWNLFDLDWKTWPRACALAEALWLGADKPGFDDFLARMRVHRRRLVAAGVNCANLD